MAPKQKQNKVKKAPRRRLPTRALASLTISNSKLSPRRNFPGRANRRGRMNVNAVSTFNGTERVTTLTIPTNAAPGQLLFTLENNPNSAPRARATATQFDSWHSVTEMEVETTGNAFSKNFVVLRHIPNGDPSRLPSDDASLLNLAEAYSRPLESYKLQLDSNRKGVVRAPWKGTSYNPRKPINDTDPSERNNGIFIIVANGSPGTETVDITIRYRYSFQFYGPIFQAILPDTSAYYFANTGMTPALPFGTSPNFTGPGGVSITNNSITLKPGNYKASLRIDGTGITAAPTVTSPGVTFTNQGAVLTATGLIQLYAFTLPNNSQVSFGSVTGTTVTLAQFRASPTSI